MTTDAKKWSSLCPLSNSTCRFSKVSPVISVFLPVIVIAASFSLTASDRIALRSRSSKAPSSTRFFTVTLLEKVMSAGERRWESNKGEFSKLREVFRK